MVETTSDPLGIDPAAAGQEIQQFLRRKLRELGKAGILIGLSGGLDSAVAAYLSVAAVGPENVRLLNLPDRDSKPRHRRDAQLVAREVGVRLQVRDLTPLLEAMGIYDLLPVSTLPGRALREIGARVGRKLLKLGPDASVLEARFRAEPNSFVSKGIAYAMAKHRLRMLLLYQQAEVEQLLVVGAANLTEFMTGTFSLWGCDHCADAMPLLHLYRTQLVVLAQHLGLPDQLLAKAADPDLIPGLDDKEKLLGSFLQTDRVLLGLAGGESQAELRLRYGEALVGQVLELVELSAPMRASPYHLPLAL